MREEWILALFAVGVAHFIAANIFAIALLSSALVQARRRWQRTRLPAQPGQPGSPLTLPLSVIIPALDEHESVVDSVLSVLHSPLPDLEVIVVDDGSTDPTVETMTRAFDLVPVEPDYPRPLPSAKVKEIRRSRTHRNVWLMVKENGGKADAVNAGVNLASFRYVLITDADSVFEPGALLAAMRAIGFDSATHVGMGGLVRVRNGIQVEDGRLTNRRLPRSMLELFQVVEYMGAMTGNRAGWDAVNGVPVLSGAFSIWRRDVVLQLGGMATDTTHEDIEFTFRVHEHFRRLRTPYRIGTLPDAIVWTEAPHRWRDLYRQRKRWQRVVYECVWRYRRTIGNPRYGEFGTVTMPYMLGFEALGPFVQLALTVLVVLMGVWGILAWTHLGLFLVFSAALVAFTRILSIIADASLFRRFPPRAMLRLSGVALFEMVLYQPVILFARIMAFSDFIRGRRTWERAQRRTRESVHV